MVVDLVSFLLYYFYRISALFSTLRIILVFIMAQKDIKVAMHELTADYANEVIIGARITGV